MIGHRGWRIAVSFGVLTIFTAGTAPAQTQAPETAPAVQGPADKAVPAPLDLPPLPRKKSPPQRFGDWSKNCDVGAGNKVGHCHLTQILMHNRNDKRVGILMLRMGYFGQRKTPSVILRVPLALGVYLPAGLTLNVPGAEPLKAVIISCLPQGCLAEASLSSDMVAAMKNANTGSVALQTLRKQSVKLPVSFKGITAGLASLNKG